MLDRIAAQIAVLDFACEELNRIPGDILELGLGRGNTYDRLRTLFPSRRICAFDTKVTCAPDARPPEEDLIIGDVLETLPAYTIENGRGVVLGNYDVGGYDQKQNDELARRVGRLLKEVMVPGGMVISSSDMGEVGGWSRVPDPFKSSHEHFIYRVMSVQPSRD